LNVVGGRMNVQLCFLTTAFRYVNAFADWMSLGMIALSRYGYFVDIQITDPQNVKIQIVDEIVDEISPTGCRLE
jgi:hypothetical protein